MIILPPEVCEVLPRYILSEILFGKALKLNFGRWDSLFPKIGNNEVLTNESLPLDYAWQSCM